MVNHFEEETQPLTDDEMAMVPLIARGLMARVGKENAITGASIVSAMTQRGLSLSAPRLRKIINHIRIHRYVTNLVASSKGYYVSNDPVEIKIYMESLMQRAQAILAVKESFKVPETNNH